MDAGEKSPMEVVVLLLAGAIGTGVLVLPKAMAAVGYGTMVGLLSVGCLISATTTWMLLMAVAAVKAEAGQCNLKSQLIETDGQGEVQLTKKPFSLNYAQLLARATSERVAMVLDFMLIFYAGGAVVTYFLFVADFVQHLSFWPECLTVNKTILLMAAITYPFTLFRTVGKLAKLSSLVLFSISFLTFGIWFRAPSAVETRSSPVSAAHDVDKVGMVLCICIYSFVWHTNAVGVAQELYNPTPARCLAISVGATSLLALFYGFIAFGGYWSWGDQVGDSIVRMYDADDPLFTAIRLSLTASLIIATIINVFPLRESCINLVGKVVAGYDPSMTARAGWSFGVIAVAACTAIAYPTVVKIISLLGGTVGPFVAIIWPTVISKMVLSEGWWRVALAVLLPVSLYMNLAALGFLGSAIN